MADTTVDSGANDDEKKNIPTNINSELSTKDQNTEHISSLNIRHSTPGDFCMPEKRFGVVDFEVLGAKSCEVLEEFDPLSLNQETPNSSQNSTLSSSMLAVKEDKSLARYSAPGMLYRSQENGECSNEFGASNLVYETTSADDLLTANENRDQRNFEHSQFDDDLERTSKKELEQMNKEDSQSKNQDGEDVPIYPSSSLSNDFHNVARYHILSVSGSDKSGRLTIVFSACRIPPLHSIDHHQLFLYIRHTLDQYVESDYTIVYFHYGLTSKNKPSFQWLLQVYRELDRKYRKNVKALYIVHPSNFIKIVWGFFRKFTSTKFAKKVTYVNCLQELSEHIHLNQLDIPKEVQEHDDRVLTRYKPKPSSSSVFHTSIPEIPKTQQFGVSLSWIKENEEESIPRCIRISVEFLRENGLDVEGIFRRSANSSLVKRVAEMFNRGQPVDYKEHGDVHCAAAIIKKFLRELPEPLLTFELCDTICLITAITDHDQKLMKSWSVLHDQLPERNFELLKYIMMFLKEVQEHKANKMTASNLAIVFGPNLIWGKNQSASLDAMAQINTFTCLMLENVVYLFGDPDR